MYLNARANDMMTNQINVARLRLVDDGRHLGWEPVPLRRQRAAVVTTSATQDFPDAKSTNAASSPQLALTGFRRKR
jgi:hypothetical protein